MLNSKSSQFPNGIANSTGLVGRYIMDTVGSDVGGYLPILEDLPPHNEDGVGGMHMYMPWWLYKEQKADKMPFARGYHIEIGGGRGLARSRRVWAAREHILGGGYGVELKQNLRKIYGCQSLLLRSRRDDPQRRQLLRDRSRHRRPVGHPRPSLPLQMEPG